MRAYPVVAGFTAALVGVGALAQAPVALLGRLRALAGEWQGTHQDGRTARATFRVVSGGSAVEQELVEDETREDMITMFHGDGVKLVLTHYCSVGNQPRMKGRVSPDGRSVAFETVGVSNLRPAQGGHMVRLVLRLIGPDRHTEEWTFADQRGVRHTDVIDFRRTAK
jgi:hypothetical protein